MNGLGGHKGAYVFRIALLGVWCRYQCTRLLWYSTTLGAQITKYWYDDPQDRLGGRREDTADHSQNKNFGSVYIFWRTDSYEPLCN